MIDLNNIQFSYTKGSPVLSGITASLQPGIHLLAGENGAGKTTLLKVMAGIGVPDSGECLINDYNALSDNPSQRGRVFLLEENMNFPTKNILQFAKCHSVYYPNFSQSQFEDNLRHFGLTGLEEFKHQSLGNRKKAQLAYVLALGTDLLLLDEPTNGLDIQSKSALRRAIAESLKDTQTLIISTHTVSELENMFDGGIIISKGELLCAATTEEISDKLEFTSTSTPPDDALYSELENGRYHNISKSEGLETKPDWRVLYNALNSTSYDKIISILNQ